MTRERHPVKLIVVRPYAEDLIALLRRIMEEHGGTVEPSGTDENGWTEMTGQGVPWGGSRRTKTGSGLLWMVAGRERVPCRKERGGKAGMGASEVAALRAQMAQEAEAMQQGLTGYAVSARHAVIEAQYRRLGEILLSLTHF